MDGRKSAGVAAITDGAIKNASDLRDLLRRAELALAGLKRGTAEQAADVVRMIGAAERAIPRLETQFGVDLKAERGRLQTLESRLRSNAPLLVSRARPQRLQQLRREVEPGDDEWWWRLDEMVAAQRRQRLRRLGVRVGAVAAVLLVVAVAYQVFLAPSLETQAGDKRIRNAEAHLAQGRLEPALVEYRAALGTNADRAEVQIAVAAILEQLGRGGEAEPYFAKARDGSSSEANYYASLAMVYYRMSAQGGVNAVDKAAEAALRAVAADGNSAVAHLALGSVYELQDRVPEAIEALKKAASLSTDAALTASIQVRVAMLSQRIGDLPTAEGETPQ